MLCHALIGAQWTGIVTTIAVEMLKAGIVEAVVCVQRYFIMSNAVNLSSFYESLNLIFAICISDPEDRFTPRPVLARFIIYSIFAFLCVSFLKNSFNAFSSDVCIKIGRLRKSLQPKVLSRHYLLILIL